ncbi:MAG: hypothetical protein DYH06_04285 [Acidobacteria bacterium ACB2]|nr:hypothetical protein [Acidobacteria bacterium ACB2]
MSQLRAAVASEEERLVVLERLKIASIGKAFAEGFHGGTTTTTAYGSRPSSWAVRALRECATIQTGITKGRSIPDEESVELPYLRVANVQDGYLDLGVVKSIRLRRSEIERYLLQVGDVLLTEGGDFDKLGRGYVWSGEVPRCVHQNHVFAVRTDRGQLLPEFFSYLAQSPYGKRYFLTVAHKTTNLACINSTKLGDFPVLLPPLSEQREIVEVLKAVDRRVGVSERRRMALGALSRATLVEILRGHVRIPPPAVAEPPHRNA